MIDHSNWWMFIFSCCSPINIIAYKKSIMQPQGLVYIDWNKYLKNKLYQIKREKILKLRCGVAWANCNVVYEDLSFLAQIELESWTENCKQIHEIKWNRFLSQMFYNWFLAIFYRNCQNLLFGWPAGYSPPVPSISKIFLKCPYFLGSWGISLTGDNNWIMFSLGVQDCTKTWSSLLLFCSVLSENFPSKFLLPQKCTTAQ